MEMVEEPTACQTLLGTIVCSNNFRMALLGRPRRPLPDIMLYSQNQLFSTLKNLKCMYCELENP